MHDLLMLKEVQGKENLLNNHSGLRFRKLTLGLPFQDRHQGTFGLVFKHHVNIVLILIELEQFKNGGAAFECPMHFYLV
jgi:hypothetical protein